MNNGFNAATVGIVGGYPNGGFPSQAFYGIMGTPSGAQKAGPASASANAGNFNLFTQASTVTVVGTILILMLGGYWLWHVSY